MPEGYGQKDDVQVSAGNQVSASNAVTFDYTNPKITSVQPYCGTKSACREPVGLFETDGCADKQLWEDFVEWKGRVAGALEQDLGSKYERKCGFDNDRWQMALIKGSSLGSHKLAEAMAKSGSPLKVSVSRMDQEVPYAFLEAQGGRSEGNVSF